MEKPIMIKDFFYIEAGRIASFAGQMNENGARNQVTKTSGMNSALSAGGGIGGPMRLFHAKADVSSSANEQLAAVFNTFIPEVVAFTDFVQANEVMPERRFDVSQLRNIVGKMRLYDLGSAQALLKDEQIETLISENWEMISRAIGDDDQEESVDSQIEAKRHIIPRPKQKRDRQHVKNKVFEEPAKAKAVVEKAIVFVMAAFFRNLDVPVVGNIEDDLGRVFWFTLNKEHLSHVNGEIILKYRGLVPGIWNVTCIIDEVPQEDQVPAGNFVEQMLIEFHALRNQLFDIKYAVSPLAIFRNLE